ncbi:MAG: AAC(3) family N-acetyltransferase [Spirochaetota bacterium]
MTSINDIIEGIKGLGIAKGDVVHIHTAMRSLGPVEQGFTGITAAFQEVITDSGIFSVPAHSWDIVGKRNPVFHALYTSSNLGAYSNHLLGDKSFLRSLHPTHSICSWGAESSGFIETGMSTPCPVKGHYARLDEWNGKILLLGVNCTRCTYFHYVEELAGLGEIWSLWEEPVTIQVIDAHDTRHSVVYRGHRDCKSENFYRIESGLLSEGIMTQRFVGPAPVKVIDAAKAREWLLPRLQSNPKFFW